jgi:CHAT domain-containing protein/tetratricopeptide (TPR) repeat protein
MSRGRASSSSRAVLLVCLGSLAAWSAAGDAAPATIAAREPTRIAAGARPLQPAPAARALPLEATQLVEDARALRKAGKYDEALPRAEQALTIRETAFGAESLEVAEALHLVALLLDDKHEYARAETVNRRALAIREQQLGPDHPDVALSLSNLAWLAKVKQDFAGAETLYRRALDIQERALGPDHADVATTLNDLAILFNQTGRYDQAIAANERVIGIRESARPANDAGVALALNNLSRVYINQGEYDRAAEVLRRALSLWEAALGPDHPSLANALDGLAQASVSSGDYATAEPLFVRALAIREKTLGPNHAEVGTSLNNLAVLYRLKGDLARSEPLLLRDLAITENALGPDHAFVAPTLTNLALVYQQQEQFARADAHYRRALSIQERALGPAHLAVGITLSRLGRLYLEDRTKDVAEAESLLRRAVATLEKAVGPHHPEVAASLTSLAIAADRKGDHLASEDLVRRALEIQERVLGPSHPDVARSLERLAAARQRRGDAAAATEYLTKAFDIRERHLARNLPLGSDRQRIGYLTLFANDTDRAMALHIGQAPSSPAAIDLAVTTLLRRKGRALDAATDSVAVLRRHAADGQQGLFDRLATARARLAAVTLRGPGTASPAAYRANLARLEEGVDSIERELSAQSAAFRADAAPVTRAAVQEAIPNDATLLEYASFQSRDPATGQPLGRRYVVYVLTAGSPPRWVDLGDAAPIDTAIGAWRLALRDPQRTDAARLGRAVDALVMQPVRQLLDARSRLLIAPDGILNLIPFAALVDETNRFLVDRFAITYLTSGRDLLRLQFPQPSRATPLIVAAPAFGEPAGRPAGPTGTPASGTRIDQSRIFFGPLPGASHEVRSIRPLLPDATVLVSDRATEAAVKAVAGPRLLHIATHGFFLGDEEPSGASAGSRVGKWAARADNPLLRSGLALAGANQGRSGSDDGVLTALEATGLDLWGTKLVVLSACDTGVGEVKQGDGVYGLRRALILAGAESQLMSLWPISDRSTRDLMTGYYTRLTHGESRSEALRQTQLAMLRDRRLQHPYHWASFIQSGAWTSLEPAR